MFFFIKQAEERLYHGPLCFIDRKKNLQHNLNYRFHWINEKLSEKDINRLQKTVIKNVIYVSGLLKMCVIMDP